MYIILSPFRSPNYSQIHPFISTQICIFFKCIKSNLRWLIILGCETFHWSAVNLVGATFWKKTDSSHPSNYWLPKSSWLGEGECTQLSPLCLDLVWLRRTQVLCFLSQPLWIHMCKCLAMHSNPHFFLLHSFCSLLCHDSWASGREGVIEILHLGMNIPQSLVLWVLASINHHLL